MSNQILLDSSILVSACNPKAPLHHEALAFLRLTGGRLLLLEVALNEVAYLLNREAGLGGVKFFIALVAALSLPLQSVTIADLWRVQDIMDTYATARFDFVDACLMALSERPDITRIAMLDRRHFAIYRPAHCKFFELLP